MSGPSDEGILTLEPLIEAIRGGVEGGTWELSGLQKTTSHQFEGRWEGESTRSAYLFFHSLPVGEFVSIDVYLDETTRGLTGNLALVVDLVSLGELGDGTAALTHLSRLSTSAITRRGGRPVTLRLRLADAASEASEAECEVRFKIRLPRRVIAQGPSAVRELSQEAVAAFERILESPELRALTAGG